MRSRAPRILVTGARGQVGWELQRSLACLGDVIACERSQMDLGDTDSVVKALQHLEPDIVVNAAAYTAVDKAEEEQDLAAQVNATIPGVLAEEMRRRDGLLIHYSTDYVFGGQGDSPFSEQDPTGPLNVYGKTKLQGEQNITQVAGRHIIFRTSWVYSHRGQNFMKSMIRLGQERETLRIVADQVGAPTCARLISDVTAQVLHEVTKEVHDASIDSGIYHLVAEGETSWFDFANAIFEYLKKQREELNLKVQRVEPITSAEYPTPAMRPHNSRLSTGKLQARFNLFLPNWQDDLERCLADIC